FGQEARESARFDRASERGFAAAMRRNRTRSLLTALAIAAIFGANLYGLYAGVAAVLDGRLSAGTLGQIALLIGIIASSAAVLAEVWGDLLRAAGASERLLELLQPPAGDGTAEQSPGSTPLPASPSGSSPPSSRQPTPSPSPPRALGIVFDDVVFRYPSRPDAAALDRLSFDVAPGSTVALVGASGAGKTTVFQVLQRFYPLESGRILLDGEPIDRLPLAALRSRIAIVPQEPVIFSGTAADNIRYAVPDASDQAVAAAAREAFADEFIRALPDGYQSHLGERGVRLSGGQRQRIAIARAILANRPILLLDEATSALDAQSERVVQQALDAARSNRTTLIIAHRLATVLSADRILVLEAGRIVDAGSHAELLAHDGVYARIARLQFHAN
ncbi:MAG: ATP-binding cassette domain-containing protein, partial [Lautropia sp.]